ncbi:benzoylformate decarboxylase [Kibdelosporangium banguiense]|uniref:Benzoylformate decarboxylase n=1 Tax=Kibdelosporangium banguiense TaxID=1365924 RepID=A0ABS4U3B1_9PSEU|nr:benzoylformate decarboxylase [Kibdelosporangium banguiense]MBP2330684.1 benzoylformate decarboxylase [Kibdelosporangium banguiense]
MTGRTVREISRDLMRAYGLTTVFGNPGSTEVPFLRDWPNDFRYVLGLQESIVVAMADGYAQAGGGPVLVNLHSAGGVGHGLGHIFTAYRNRTPMIVVAGQQVRSLLPGEPFLGATDAASFPKPYVKWSCEPARPDDVPSAIAHAYHLSTQPPYGPTFISIPADDWDIETTSVTTARPRIAGPVADPDALRALVSAIDGSKRPGIVVGPAVDIEGAVADMVTLAERIQAGVRVSPMSSRCSFPEDHPLFQGFLDPEQRSIAAALEEYDLVLVFGAPVFTHHVFRGVAEHPLPELFVLSDDDDLLARAGHGTGIRTMLRPALRQLSELVAQVDRPTPKPLDRPEISLDGPTITAEKVFTVLSQMLPDNAIVVEEAPSHRGIMHDHLPIRSRHTGFLTVASGTLGYGLPAAVGAALARPDRRIVAVIGDGSSMYGIQALWTAVREHLPVTFVILDNSQYAALAILAGADGAKLPGVDLGGIDFVALAAGMGCAGVLVDSLAGLREALARSLTDDGPTLLHVPVVEEARTLY